MDASEASFSFAAVERMSARFGGALQALGLRKGDRVALILPNNDDFVLCFLGAIRAGIVPAPIYPPMALGQLQAYLDNTRHIVAKSGARVLVTTAKIKRLLGTVQAACPALEQVVAIEGIRESTEPLKPEKVGLDDVAFLQFTSGSTSRPKGVTLTHANLAANIKCIMEDGLRSGPEDVGISWLPLYHDMGLIGFVLAPLYHLVPIVYLAGAPLSQAAGHLVSGDHAAPGLDRLRAELRLRALHQAHQGGRARGARPVDVARGRLRRRADPAGDARGLRRRVREDRLPQGGAPALVRHGRVVARGHVHRARRGRQDHRRERPRPLGEGPGRDPRRGRTTTP